MFKKPIANKNILEKEIIILKNHIKRLEPYEKAYKLADSKIQVLEGQLKKHEELLNRYRKALRYYVNKYGTPSETEGEVEITKEVVDYLNFLIKTETDDRPNTKL